MTIQRNMEAIKVRRECFNQLISVFVSIDLTKLHKAKNKVKYKAQNKIK